MLHDGLGLLPSASLPAVGSTGKARRTEQKPSPGTCPVLSPSIFGPAETPRNRTTWRSCAAGAAGARAVRRLQQQHLATPEEARWCRALGLGTHTPAAPMVPDAPGRPSSGC